MLSQSHVMVLRRRQRNLLTLEEVASRCGLHPALVERLLGLGLIDPVQGSTRLFSSEAPYHLQRLMRLRRDLGLTYSAATLVLELLQRIETLEARVRQLEARG
jgi:transcriptional regulator with XRE-family HTH domain